MKTTFTIVVRNQSSWDRNGVCQVLDDCGHKHRTARGAIRCYYKLCGNHAAKNETPRYSQKWFHGRIETQNGELANTLEISNGVPWD